MIGAAAAAGALLALSATPLRVVVPVGSALDVAVRNPGGTAVTVAADPAAYRLDLRGRPVLGRARERWLVASPRRLVLAAGATALVRVRAVAPANAGPGDHARVLLLAASTGAGKAIALGVRVGVVVVVRCPGRLRRRVVPLGVGLVRGRVLRAVVANRGNVDEWLAPARLTFAVSRGSTTVRLRTPGRRILAGTRAVFDWPLPRGWRGAVRVRAAIAGAAERRYVLRL